MDAPERVLFIGNSYTQRNDLPGMIAELVRAGTGLQVVTERVIANGASLRQHWNAGRAEALIRGGQWDVVVLQEQSTLPVKNATRYHENVRLFLPLLGEKDAQIAYYLPWPRQAAPDSLHALIEAVSSIAGESGGIVVPVGPAWEIAGREGFELPLYDKDGSHPTPAGSYLAACVFYGALWGRSPEGLPAPSKLETEAATALQRYAWSAAQGPRL
jgi:hypothetical protein